MRRTAPAALIALIALSPAALAACGDDDGGGAPDAGALLEAFDERTAALYEAEDLDRDEVFTRGVTFEACPMLEDEHAEAVLAAAGIEGGDVERRGGYLQGMPGETEMLSCPLVGGEGREDQVLLVLGATLRDRDQVEQAIRRSGFPDARRAEVDGTGLPADEVLVLQVERSTKAYWVSDGFFVSVDLLSAEEEATDDDRERAVAALAEAVEQVDDALTG